MPEETTGTETEATAEEPALLLLAFGFLPTFFFGTTAGSACATELEAGALNEAEPDAAVPGMTPWKSAIWPGCIL